jgi:flagellar hook assembly protein FlgD
MELLPGNYNFRTGLDGNNFSKTQYVSGISVVTFIDGSKSNTGNIVSDEDVVTSGSLTSPFTSIEVYPNPFRDVTNISFDLNEESTVTLVIYDMSGKKVISLLDRKLPAGTHQIKWYGTSGKGETLESGVYIYRLISDNNIETGRLILSK